ncbi:insulinase family protein [Mycoplasmatota bacterium]|nr:insulinase family protein [Mycoplasmatota bacterium]
MKKKLIRGIEVNYIPVNKYKHMMIAMNFFSEANSKTFNERNMILDLLENHNSKYKTSDQLNLHLDMLYGARLKTFVFNKGNLTANNFNLKFVNKKYLNEEEDLIQSAFLFLKDLVYSPKMYDQLLTKKATAEVVQEANELLQTISQDKASKAYFQYMKSVSNNDEDTLIFPNEKYLNSVTNKSITDVYQTMIQNDKLKLYIIGDINEQELDQIIENTFDEQLHTIDIKNISLNRKYIGRDKPQEITEYDDVSISRIFLGYKLSSNISQKDLDIMILLNTIIGGYSQSRLFNEIRENRQLVYYIYSMYDNNSSLMTINFELEPKDTDEAIETVKDIIEDIKNGKITDEEINLAKNYLIKYYKSSADSLSGILQLNILADMNQEKGFDLEKKITYIEEITKDNLQSMANKLFLDTIFKFVKKDD